jgi:hypothetical protein
MTRTMTGHVPGGIQSRQLPSAIQPGELAVHAVGRLDTMSEILVQSAWLRSARFASQATGFGRARFQDVKGDYTGTNKIAAAHRALFALLLDGQNAADVTQVFVRPRLRQMIIAPQARTDLVSRPVNYADQLLENAISERVFGLFRSAIEQQRPGQPVQKDHLLATAHGLKQLLHRGFEEAADQFHAGQLKRGWKEFRPGSGPAPLAGVTDGEIDDFLNEAFGGGMKVHVSGPTGYGDLTEIILGTSQEITDRATLAIDRPGEMERQIHNLESVIPACGTNVGAPSSA